MSFFKHLFTFILMIIQQFFSFGLIMCFYGLIMQLALLLPPLVVILLIAFCFIIFELNRFFNRKYMFIKLKTYILGYMLPITVIYIALQIVFIANSGPLNELIQEDIFPIYLVLAFIPAISWAVYFLSACFSMDRCATCKKIGFSLFRLEDEVVLDEWYEDAGTANVSKTVTVRDSSGNTYEGEIDESVPKVTTYQKRGYTFCCRNCDNYITKVSTVKIGLIQNLLDMIKH